MEHGRDEETEERLRDIILDGGDVMSCFLNDNDGLEEQQGEEAGYSDRRVEEERHDYDGSGDRMPVQEGDRDDGSGDRKTWLIVIDAWFKFSEKIHYTKS